MTNVKYDLDKLTASGAIDAADAARRFYTYQEYFDKLTLFLEEWPSYLRLYNPMVVIYDADTRKMFQNDCSHIRASLSQLGMNGAISELNSLENAIIHNDVKSLSDGLQTFQAALEINAGIINGSVRHDKPIIMAVNDRPEVLSKIHAALKGQFTVITLTNGADALETLKTQAPVLFLLDTEMPVINGYELALLIREFDHYKDTPIIFITGSAARANVSNLFHYRTNAFLLNPFDSNTLLTIIHSFL